MASLVSDSRIALEKRCGVRVFTANSWRELYAWLDELESGMSEEHRLGLAAAYPAATAS